jgi:uncharacterized SAM-binding protein YcdF (DUF218 family)
MSVWRSDRQTELTDKRPSKLSGKRMKITTGVVVVISLLLFLFREQWLMVIGNFLIVQDQLHPADVIHVIAGDDYRTDYAIHLYMKGYGKKLFFTGGWCDIHHYWHGEHARERALAQGIASDAIIIDDSRVLSTYMEAERLKEWMAKSPDPVRSIIVVSDPFHMRRARWTYQNLFGDSIKLFMEPVPFDFTPYRRVWWKDQASRENVKEEYTKSVYYILRYQLSRGELRKWLVSLDVN